MITQTKLKELFTYNPDTGIFTRNKSRKGVPKRLNNVAGNTDSKGYLRVSVDRREYRLHRLAFLYMTGTIPIEIDHKNRIRWDNRWKNLRDVKHVQNSLNNSLRSDNTSGNKGVYFNKRNKNWVANITIKGKCHYIGSYPTKEEANTAYELANQAAFADPDYKPAITIKNSSGIRGVTWSKSEKKWKVTYSRTNKNTHGGYFKSIEEAEQKYKELAHSHDW